MYTGPRLRRLHRRGAADRRELRAGLARGRRVHACARADSGHRRRVPLLSRQALRGHWRVTGFKPPEINDYKGDFFDLDIYGTYNFTQNFGIKGGYRTLDASYLAKHDNGSLKLKGL